MKRALSAAVAVVAVLVALPRPATGQEAPLSAGCQELNEEQHQGTYAIGGLADPLPFFQGETITVMARDLGQGPIEIELDVAPTPNPPGFHREIAPLPPGGSATLTYIVPADGDLDVEWAAGNFILQLLGPVEWTVTCTAAAYPLAVSTPRRAAEIGTPAADAVTDGGGDFPAAALGTVAVAVLVQWGLWWGATRRRKPPGASAAGRA